MQDLAQRIDALVADIVAEFSSGDLSRLVSHFDFPLAVHMENRLQVMHRPDDLIDNFANLIERRRKEGLVSVSARVVAVDVPRNHRFRAWVHFTHCDASGQVARQSDWIQFCRDHNPRIAVEMLHITRLAIPSARLWPKAPRHMH